LGAAQAVARRDSGHLDPKAPRILVRRLQTRIAPRSREASGTDVGMLRSLCAPLGCPHMQERPQEEPAGGKDAWVSALSPNGEANEDSAPFALWDREAKGAATA
jgi:hypothetical protein